MLRKLQLIVSIVIFCTVFLFSSSLNGEENESSLEKYKWALQFGIFGDLTLGSFEAGDISFKRQLSPKSALRFGISIGYSYSSRNSTNWKQHEYWNDISIMYQRYINPSSRAKFYWGIGPYLHYKYIYNKRSEGDEYIKYWNNIWGLGVLGMGGIEWFATSVISFHAEYRVYAVYKWTKDNRERKYTGGDVEYREDTLISFDIENSSSVLFGISVYF